MRVYKTYPERIRELELALTAALQYLPRNRYACPEGIDNGKEIPAGPALQKVIDQSEEALNPYVQSSI